jgi:hypothetical protein
VDRETEEIGGSAPKSFDKNVRPYLESHAWSGNVAELMGLARRAAEAAQEWEEVKLHHVVPYLESRHPVAGPDKAPADKAESPELTDDLPNLMRALSTYQPKEMRKELVGSLKLLQQAYGNLSLRLLESALEFTRDRFSSQRSGRLGDLSPTSAIKLLLDRNQCSTTEAADEINRLRRVQLNPPPDTSSAAKAIDWAEKRRYNRRSA